MENKIVLLREKISQGIELAFQRLVEKKSREDGEFVFSKDGEIIHIKAKDLLK